MLLLGSLIGCGSTPMGDRYSHSKSAVRIHQVQRGDTLYSIAFRYGLDYRKVAQVNKINEPYIIYPGQNIYLWQVSSAPVIVTPAPSPVASAPAAPAGPGASAVVVTAVPDVAAATVSRVTPPAPVYQGAPPGAGRQPVQTAPAPVERVQPASQAPVIETPPITSPVADSAPLVMGAETPVADPAIVVVAGEAPAMAAAPAEPPSPTPAPPPARPPAPGGKVTSWRWPTAGGVTRGYSSSVHKGIDISGGRGDPIYAVADGTVVYAGTGIVGFGELVIIKHNDIFISAYGHNDRLLVRENDVVGAGQLIAEKGSSGTDTVKLHFEIRKEGKPIDPLKLLPRR